MPGDYRPDWSSEEMTAFQIYEEVSEGTPVSPVFQSEEELVVWLRNEAGLSPEAITHFVDAGWVPSLAIVRGKMFGPGLETAEYIHDALSDPEEDN